MMQKFIYCPLCATKLEESHIEDRQRQYCPNCHYVHYINPIPATAVIGERDGKILLIKRGMEPGKGLWTLPSGFMEASETPEEGCLRELQEETGMHGEITSLIGVFHEYSKMYGDILNIFYHVNLDEGIPIGGDDADDAELVPIEKIENLGFRCFNLAFAKFNEARNKNK
ncbi:MAG: NUDIX hydrolase [Bacillota bacterium]|nr:NUDIX hydrolase [Bacillota bacterium]